MTFDTLATDRNRLLGRDLRLNHNPLQPLKSMETWTSGISEDSEVIWQTTTDG
jgi:hypothetical protein